MKSLIFKRLLWGLLAIALAFSLLSGCGSRQNDIPRAPLSAAAPAPGGVWGASSSASGQSTATDAAPTEVQRVTVYVTETGGKYHCSGCSYLSQSCIPIELETAKRRYGPCSKCTPPS